MSRTAVRLGLSRRGQREEETETKRKEWVWALNVRTAGPSDREEGNVHIWAPAIFHSLLLFAARTVGLPDDWGTRELKKRGEKKQQQYH